MWLICKTLIFIKVWLISVGHIFKGSLTHLQVLQVSMKLLLQMVSGIRVLEFGTFQLRNKKKKMYKPRLSYIFFSLKGVVPMLLEDNC